MGRIRLQMDEYYSISSDRKQISLLFGAQEPEVLPCAMDALILPWMPFLSMDALFVRGHPWSLAVR
jgi:hypothetical protein